VNKYSFNVLSPVTVKGLNTHEWDTDGFGCAPRESATCNVAGSGFEVKLNPSRSAIDVPLKPCESLHNAGERGSDVKFPLRDILIISWIVDVLGSSAKVMRHHDTSLLLELHQGWMDDGNELCPGDFISIGV
jgi:hypothetical protein